MKSIKKMLSSNAFMVRKFVEIVKYYINFKSHLLYRKHKKAFIAKGGQIDKKYKIISDFNAQAGRLGQYFVQDLHVARMIYENQPNNHFDVGSRIDGFIAHVATFMKINIMDIRPLDSQVRNIKYIQQDLMNPKIDLLNSLESISCLHAIEHFGLGRYGDEIDPKGHIKGFENIIRMLKPNGILYISFPISSHERIEFNAHRVFHQKSILNWSPMINTLDLKQFDYVDDQGKLYLNQSIDDEIAKLNYGVGIYTFKKL